MQRGSDCDGSGPRKSRNINIMNPDIIDYLNWTLDFVRKISPLIAVFIIAILIRDELKS